MKIVIDIPEEMYKEYVSVNLSRGNGKTITDNLLKAIKNGTPQPKWIPVTERLPEDNIHVLCQFTLSGMGECYLAHGVFHVVGGVVMTCNEVIAWMPLPEPYRK